ncbi:C40 family peptidase [Sporosarcina sp. GW1-11]|uniref:C40 family peptidase n=1 Tax=Sporosarcina sp. GW1-11 TaxID=2899126 RepID=UPI00294EB7D8|nr:C40 family peptidase [Sporosarcina sp. GW1-11]MDV6377295.1 C40 family peptidase [Sporosarcina sp. GW1-11]
MNERWICAVSVAAVWTDPDAARLVDLPALDHPVQLEKWLGQLSYQERLALSTEKRIQTQLLYGESVIVEEVVGDWAKIIAISQPSQKDPRGYPGWVPLVQLSMREKPRVQQFVRVTARETWITELTGEPFLRVSFNTVFPCGLPEGKRMRVWTPHGWKLIGVSVVERLDEVTNPNPLTAGRKFIGLPYLWGGMSAWGFDCSGFIHNLWKACGVLLPRDACDQAETGIPVSLNQEEWKLGDLLFFSTNEDTSISHVGMYAGNGRMLHAPSTGKSVEQIKLVGSEYTESLCSVRRVNE